MIACCGGGKPQHRYHRDIPNISGFTRRVAGPRFTLINSA
jgi:hypothetical protein